MVGAWIHRVVRPLHCVEVEEAAVTRIRSVAPFAAVAFAVALGALGFTTMATMEEATADHVALAFDPQSLGR